MDAFFDVFDSLENKEEVIWELPPPKLNIYSFFLSLRILQDQIFLSD